MILDKGYGPARFFFLRGLFLWLAFSFFVMSEMA